MTNGSLTGFPDVTAPGELVHIHTLHPGDLAIGERGDRLDTLLGSCVAIVLTDPRRTVGAMCHYVHPGRAGLQDTEFTKFGHEAIEAMAELLLERGIVARLCQAYVLGGGDMLSTTATHVGVGARNLRFALDALSHLGVDVLAIDAGGPFARRVIWTVGPEAPWVQRVPMKEQA